MSRLLHRVQWARVPSHGLVSARYPDASNSRSVASTFSRVGGASAGVGASVGLLRVAGVQRSYASSAPGNEEVLSNTFGNATAPLYMPETVHTSTGAVETVTNTFSGVSGVLSDTVVNTTAQLIEPLTQVLATGAQAGEVAAAGLDSSTPAGLVRILLENVSVYADMPWWATIVTVTVAWRMLIFPIACKTQVNNVGMKNIKPEVDAYTEKAKMHISNGEHGKAGDVNRQMWAHMAANNVSYSGMFAQPMVQMPFAMGMFFGLRKMAEAPIASMTAGGTMWFSDLTAADPTYALPVLSGLTTLCAIELGAEGTKASEQSDTMRTVLRIMPFAMVPLVAQFPAALLLYWCANNVVSLSQVALFKIQYVRNFIGVPAVREPPPRDPSAPPPMDFWETLKTAQQMQLKQDGQATAAPAQTVISQSFNPITGKATSTKNARAQKSRAKRRTNR